MLSSVQITYRRGGRERVEDDRGMKGGLGKNRR